MIFICAQLIELVRLAATQSSDQFVNDSAAKFCSEYVNKGSAVSWRTFVESLSAFTHYSYTTADLELLEIALCSPLPNPRGTGQVTV